MKEKIAELRSRLGRITDLAHTSALLDWDQETYLPDGAHEARANQLATIRSIAHEEGTSDELGTLLDELAIGLDLDADDATSRLVRVATRDFDKATRLSTRLVHRLAQAEALTKDAWRRARESNDYKAFAPHLKTMIDLNVEKAEALGYPEQPYDALLDQFEEGLLTRTVASVFEDLRSELVPIVEKLTRAPKLDESPIRGHFDAAHQWQLSKQVARMVGYDFSRGRLDESAHPFSTAFSINDVRITTRLDEAFFSPAFYGTLHEVGHALYEQGIDTSLERSPLADGTSLGIHESQSRFWENLIGRSRPFVEYYYDEIQRHFPGTLGSTNAHQFYQAVNAVTPSLIRVEADEVTYNLHIMIRFELELELINGSLDVRHLPDAWNARYQSSLGITPDCDANGVLQDIHWSMGSFGYFPTYTLGNILSSQFFVAADEALGGIDDLVRAGQFQPILEWLRTNIHRYGRSRSAEEIVQLVVGGGISAANWLDYVRKKYGELYGLALND